MRISDWSSDVCSSDLIFRHAGLADPGDRDPVPGGLPAPDRAGLPDRRVRHEEAAAAALPGSRGGGVLAFGVRPAGTDLPLAAAQVPRARGEAGRPGAPRDLARVQPEPPVPRSREVITRCMTMQIGRAK